MLNLVPLVVSAAVNNNPASVNYVQTYVASAIAALFSGGAVVTGSGTVSTIPLWGSHGTTLGNSSLNQDLYGDISASGGITAQTFNSKGNLLKFNGVTFLSAPSAPNSNIALGINAMPSIQGADNIAIGFNTLLATSSGIENTAVGMNALNANSTGSNNIAIGNLAGSNSSTNNDSIYIGSQGNSDDRNNTIRIETASNQTPTLEKTYISGIFGVTVDLGSGTEVYVDAYGQLGSINSSRRYKEDISDMGKASEDIMRLRPVTFRYKQPLKDGSKPVQYGLIAEEVAEVYPGLVVHNAKGQIQSVKYHVLNSLLLNEAQRQQKEITGLQKEIKGLKNSLAKMEITLASLSGNKIKLQ